MERVRKDFFHLLFLRRSSLRNRYRCVAGRTKRRLGKVFSEKNYQLFLHKMLSSLSAPDASSLFLSCFFFQLISINFFFRTTKFKFLRIFHGKAIYYFHCFFFFRNFHPFSWKLVGSTRKNYFTIFFSSFLRKRKIIQLRNSRTE